MRKLSFGPLFILLVIFLWNKLASAQDLPATLPAKKSTSVPADAPVEPRHAKRVVVKKKKTVVTSVVRVETPANLPTSLPLKKTKVIMNFDEPSSSVSSSPTIVIKDRPFEPSENEVQLVRPREMTEAPQLYFQPSSNGAIAVTDQVGEHRLRQALPDSDSYSQLPAGARPPEDPREFVTAPIPRPVVSSMIGIAPIAPRSKSAPLAPVAPVAAPTEATISSTTQPPVESENAVLVTGPLATANAQAPNAPLANEEPAPPTLPLPNPISTPSMIAHEPPAMSLANPNFLGPLPSPPPPREERPVPISEIKLDEEKATQDTDGYSTHGNPTIATTFSIPHDEKPRRRLFVRGGFLNAQYSDIESDLKNGATVFGVSASQIFSQTEVRLGIDVAHGLDQEVSLQNTRMIMFRAEGLYQFFRREVIGVYAGGALGVANVDLRSYHESNGDTVLRENAKGTALLAAPELGARFRLGSEISIDTTLQYLLFAGGDKIAKLGGLLGELALGFSF